MSDTSTLSTVAPAPPTPASEGPVAAVARPSRPRAMAHARDGVLLHVQALLEILVLSIFVVCFIIQPFRIPSESMVPTLLVGDFLLVNKQAFAPAGSLDKLLPPTAIHRGELVVFHYPVDPSMHLVKRIVGLPGDRIHLRDGHVFVNEAPLPEPYALYTRSRPDSFRDDFPSLRSADPSIDPRWWAELRRTSGNGEIVVPAGEYFVLGDNRNDSEDSRYWGFVPQANIVGRPLLVYFSLAPAAPPPAGLSLWAKMRFRVRNAWHNFRVLQ